MTTTPRAGRKSFPPELGTPLFCLVLSLAAYAYLLVSLPKALVAELSPASWPNVMILGCIATAALMCLQRLWRHRERSKLQPGADDAPGASAEAQDNRMMLLGLLGIIGYGILIDVIGFAFSTLALIAYWLVMEGMSRFKTIVLTSVLGTVALLYSFVKIAYTPLPRGVGAFDTATLAIYRALGIF
jgi:TRAP-type C4-dicarboxylate transport system permease small subunit